MVLPSPSFEFLQGPLQYVCFKITSKGELLHDDNYDDTMTVMTKINLTPL